MLRLREVCLDSKSAVLYVAATDGRLQAISAATGRLLAEILVPGLPVTASQGVVAVVERPGEHSLGAVSLVEWVVPDELKPSGGLALAWTAPLFDPVEFEQVRHGLADVELSATIGSAEVVVTGRFRLRYQGGAEPTAGTASEASEFLLAVAYDRFTGKRESRTPVGAGLDLGTAGGNEAKPGADGLPGTQILPRDPVGGQWEIHRPDGDPCDLLLDPGTQAAQIIGGRVLYWVLETPADGSGVCRYLRSRSIDPHEDLTWSHLVDQAIPESPKHRP